jgi:peptidoglycan/LPS O-acetylase OafA/YrhL
VKRSQALDVVRGIAIVLVLIWHYMPRGSAMPEILIRSTWMFWSGVDLFFVLSGFLIAGILLQSVDTKNYFSTFYIRRAARIIPLYVVIFFVLVTVIYLAPKLGLEYIANSASGHLPLWSYLTFTQNFLYAAREKFADPWMDVTWSLAVEEQFYIVLSLLIKKLRKKKLMILVVALIVIAPILRFYASSEMVAYVLPLQRADSLMFGVLLALVWQSEKGKEFLHKHAAAFRWSCFVLFFMVVYLTYKQTLPGDAWGHFGLALFYCNFIILALIQKDPPGKLNVFKSKILEWFGLRSYGIYLFHKPVQILVPFLLSWLLHHNISNWIVIPIYTVVLFVISEVSYRLLEKPIMSWGHRFKYEQALSTDQKSKNLDSVLAPKNS